MSTLMVDELYPGVQFEQEFKITRNTNLAHIRPHVYLHGTLVDGQLQVEILQGTTVLKTKTINFSLINAVKTETYAHGFLRVDFPSLQLNLDQGNTEQTYKVRFSMINHTLDLANFLGICRDWDLKIYDTYGSGVIGNQAPNDSVEPAGLEFYEYTAI